MNSRTSRVDQAEDYWIGRFDAMASPCEVLLECRDRRVAERLVDVAAAEAMRIEHKLSRYRSDNIIHTVNNSNGETVQVDDETAQLLDFAQQCFELSDGMFDVTSGVLRRAWKFDGSNRVPSPEQVEQLVPLVGWDKVSWRSPFLQLRPGMEIDLGGIGKEYAVDRTLQLIQQQSSGAILVNFGGDIATSGSRSGDRPWVVGIEDPGDGANPQRVLQIRHGGLATSGDARRFLLKSGKRYSHILNPKTGWPVEGAPHSVTVAAATCTEAGMLSTMALLQGARAEAFLRQQGVKFWVVR